MTILDNVMRAQTDAVALREITDAASAVDSARRGDSYALLEDARRNLGLVVRRASEQGLSWQAIGDALGIARGNAYQRYRRRPAARHQTSTFPGGPLQP